LRWPPCQRGGGTGLAPCGGGGSYARTALAGLDVSRRARAALQVLAAMHNTVLTIIRRSGRRPVEGFEHYAEYRNDALNAVAELKAE